MEKASKQVTGVNVLEAERNVDISSLNRVIASLQDLAPIYIDLSTEVTTLQDSLQSLSTQPNNAKQMFQTQTQLNQKTARLNKIRRSQQAYLQEYMKLLMDIDASNEEIKKAIKKYEKALKEGNKIAAKL